MFPLPSSTAFEMRPRLRLTGLVNVHPTKCRRRFHEHALHERNKPRSTILFFIMSLFYTSFLGSQLHDEQLAPV
ncbi:protein of unknown function [Methylocella tundrae]|uniref:Uncharacterized protein n=1 Tax=Methylocella tundrae TaxID=227605 RepID=A0A4U8YYT9_METTU|nr:protein of unknown function [Methylocella tundrae]